MKMKIKNNKQCIVVIGGGIMKDGGSLAVVQLQPGDNLVDDAVFAAIDKMHADDALWKALFSEKQLEVVKEEVKKKK